MKRECKIALVLRKITIDKVTLDCAVCKQDHKHLKTDWPRLKMKLRHKHTRGQVFCNILVKKKGSAHRIYLSRNSTRKITVWPLSLKAHFYRGNLRVRTAVKKFKELRVFNTEREREREIHRERGWKERQCSLDSDIYGIVSVCFSYVLYLVWFLLH